ncbi:MAG: hypothetical protein KI790_14385 [Cyclobacteriaceae bacterium]|nr:hypothetical protein [Cyclobacteriaceae bacterium HetDA_MAG_MS6]
MDLKRFLLSVSMLSVFGFVLLSFRVNAQNHQPHVEVFSAESRVRSGIALGGMGTGGIELRKDGNFYNWNIFNNYPKGSGPVFELPVLPRTNEEDAFLFFVVKYQLPGEQPKLKLLQLNNGFQGGGLLGENPIYYFPWLSSVETIEYSGRFPFVNMTFKDPEMPFDVQLEAFSPFIPHDVKNSSLPAINFRFNIVSKTEEDVEVMIIGTLRNLVGYDQVDKYFTSEVVSGPSSKYVIQGVGGMKPSHDTYGNMVMGARGGDEVTYHAGWAHRHPYYEKLLVTNRFENVDVTEDRNKVKATGEKIAFMKGDNNQICKSSVAVTKTVPSNGNASTEFFMTWFFPNAYGAVNHYISRKTHEPLDNPDGYRIALRQTEKVGHYYENYFGDVKELTTYFDQQIGQLRDKSMGFLNDFYDSSIETYILDQVNSHLNTFITSGQLDKAGRFGIREGMTTNKSWGPYATIDVSLYGSVSIVSLFPELQKAMMRAHKELQTDEGEINHGLGDDLGKTKNGTWGVYERVDLVPNYIQLVLRDYLWTNDKTYLKEMWPSIKRGIDYVLQKRDLDGDKMPDMEGIMCSYDNFPMYGLASYIQSQWIAATKMASIAAADLGDVKLSKTYAKISDKGSKLMESELWNGSYYRLYNDYNGKHGKSEGCLTDQIIGQWVAHTSGLGYLFQRDRVKSSLNAILEKSFIEDEYLRNCSWPEHPMFFPMHDTELWVDQANTPWTGVELAFASFLIYEGMVDEARKIVKAVDERYRKAGLYWDHQEFGGHYYRPMSAWSIVNALSGFNVYKDNYSFAPKSTKEDYRFFFAANNGTGHLVNEDKNMQLVARSGYISLASLTLPADMWPHAEGTSFFVGKEEVEVAKWQQDEGHLKVVFKNKLTLRPGTPLQIGEVSSFHTANR